VGVAAAGRTVRRRARRRRRPAIGPVGGATFIGTVDFLHRPQRVVVEIDGIWHDGQLDQAYDEERDDRLTAEGFEVVRIRYGDLVLRPEREVARLNRTLTARTCGG
jgi:very-short-patch-repair endonuclease